LRRIVFLMLLTTMVSAHAQTPDPQYGIKEDWSRTGSAIRRFAVKPSTIPINLPYAQLSPSDRRKVHENYESIAPGDEPPFPAAGLIAILNPLRKAQQKLLVSEELYLVAMVDGSGKVTEVSAFGSQDSAMTKFGAQVLLLTPFKPAVCSGKPCQMQFPLRLDFKLE
jgi:hypothetical protein